MHIKKVVREFNLNQNIFIHSRIIEINSMKNHQNISFKFTSKTNKKIINKKKQKQKFMSVDIDLNENIFQPSKKLSATSIP